MYIHINHKCTLLKEQATQIGLCETIIAYWGLQFVQTYKIKFPTEGHTVYYNLYLFTGNLQTPIYYNQNIHQNKKLQNSILRVITGSI